MAPTKEKEAPKRTLPINDPDTGYVSPDLSFQDGTGTLPPEEQEWHDDRDDAQAEEAEAVAEAETKAIEKREAEAKKKDEEPAPKTPAPKQTTDKS